MPESSCAANSETIMGHSGRSYSLRHRVYLWFRYSGLYLWYARLFRRAYARWVAADHTFFHRLFSQYGVKIVFDVGANVGDKADVFRHLAGRVLCLEADPDTSAILRHRFRKRSEVTVESCAVGDRDGQAQLNRKPYCGFNTLSEKWASAMDRQNVMTTDVVSVPMTTLDQLILRYGRPDYIKIDVEGYELPVVRGLTTSVPVLSFECNLPVFRAESEQVIEHLLRLDPSVRFNARLGEAAEWVLQESTDADGLRRLLDVPGVVTYDVFALSARGS